VRCALPRKPTPFPHTHSLNLRATHPPAWTKSPAHEQAAAPMVNVTFCALAPLHATGDVAMHIMGSLPSLGSWDTMRARKMVAMGSKW